MDTTQRRTQLEEQRADLDRTLQAMRESGVDPEETPADPSDAGTNLSENDRTQAMIDAAEQQRTLVVEALARIDDGTYGRCVDCDREVPAGRLEARPEAARCVECQQKADRAYA